MGCPVPSPEGYNGLFESSPGKLMNANRLLGTFMAYLAEHVIHVEVVFMVAMIAIARKVIILDVKELPSATLLGIASIIIALSAGYYLFRHAWGEERA